MGFFSLFLFLMFHCWSTKMPSISEYWLCVPPFLPNSLQCVVASRMPPTGTQLATQACALTGNWTSDPLVHRPVLSPLSHTSQGCSVFLKKVMILWISHCWQEAAYYIFKQSGSYPKYTNYSGSSKYLHSVGHAALYHILWQNRQKGDNDKKNGNRKMNWKRGK